MVRIRKTKTSKLMRDIPKEPKKRGSQNFRINARKFFLTYSHVPEELTRESVIEQLKNRINFKQYTISQERHYKGERHLHVLILAEKKIDIRSFSRFHVLFNEQVYVCKVKTIRSLPETVSYLCKDKDYITTISQIRDGNLIDKEQILIEKAREHGVYATLMDYVANNPKLSLGGRSVVQHRFLLTLLFASRRGRNPLSLRDIVPH